MARCDKRITGHPPVVVPGGCVPERPMPAPPHVPHDVFPIPEAEGIKGTLSLLKKTDSLLVGLESAVLSLTERIVNLPELVGELNDKFALIEEINVTIERVLSLVKELGDEFSDFVDKHVEFDPTELEGRVKKNEDEIADLNDTVSTLVKCCTTVLDAINSLTERVGELEESKKSVSFSIVVVQPEGATVMINGLMCESVTLPYGSVVEWTVECDGYKTQSGTLVLTEDTEIAVTLERAEVQYSDVEITDFSYEDIPASGGTVTPTLKYRQTWGWGSETGGVIEDGAEVAYSGVDEDGSHTEGSLGTTERDRTQVVTARVTVSLNGKSASSSAEIWQEANTATYSGLAFIYWEGEQDETYNCQAQQVTLAGYDTLQWRSWTSGEREMFYPLPNGHCTYTDAEECDWARATSVGYDLDANTSREMRGPHDVIETWVSEGETVSRTRHVYQEGVEYVLHSVTVSASPETAAVTVSYVDADGEGQTSSKKGSVTVRALEGSTLSWQVSLDGYITQQGALEVTDSTTVSVSLEPHSLHVNPMSVTFGNDGGTESIVINATSGWAFEILNPTGYETWIAVEPESGEAGQTTMTLKAEANTSVARSCALSISGECGSAVVAVEQDAAAEPVPTPTTDSLSFNVETILINRGFEMTVEASSGSAEIGARMELVSQVAAIQDVFTLELEDASYTVPSESDVTFQLAAGVHVLTLNFNNSSGESGLTFPVGITFTCGGEEYTLPVSML